MLTFSSTEDEAYYLKLEALWILTNLAYVGDEDTMRILASDLDPAELAAVTKADL
jgi:hypothetical protein